LSVYFNDPLASPSVSSEAQAGTLTSALLALLDSAQGTLDAAIYHLTSSDLIETLRKACDRGVRVRLVVERSQSHGSFPRCAQVRLDENGRLMHDKFAIVDGRVVWTGSANWTPSSLRYDANDAVRIESRALARAYEAEFEEMFTRRRFGPEKRDVSQERFTVAGIPLEAYFSPSDRPRKRLLELIQGAQESIALALFTLTDDELYEALRDARARGVAVEAVWDFTNLDGCLYAEVDELLREGVGTLDALPGLLHHKFAVIDRQIVITGSANWSKSGLDYNDENLLVIRDETIAQRYLERFRQLREDAQRYETSAEIPPRLEWRHFDVARDATLIQWRPKALGVVERYEICRLPSAVNANDADRECERAYDAPGWAWYFVDRNVQPSGAYAYKIRALASDGTWSAYSNVVSAKVPESIPLLTAEEAQQELQRYEGRLVTVRFTVTNRPKLSRSGHIFLNAGEDYKTDFTAFVPGCALSRFTGSGLDLFELQGKTIEVTGKLQEYNGPEIIVTGPWQIKIFDK
jgi:phosphatidylserine/phosphatidylglycerophosphate/cardiolipin synthase-like enzyme